jgi:hypothetical protein
MTRWLQAAKQMTECDGQPTPDARPGASDWPGQGVLSVKSVLSEGETIAPGPRVATVASVATPPRPKPQAAPPDAAGFPHGTACDMGLYPRTWTGRVVSLQAWRELTDWERHGPRGGHWNAATGEWEGGGDG